MRRQEISEEEKSKYRKGCLTGLAVAISVIVLASGINQITGYRTNINKSVTVMEVYNQTYPMEFDKYSLCIHISNNNFITVKTNLSDTGESVAKALKVKDEVLDVVKKKNIKGSGLRIDGQDGKVLYDSTTKGGN